MALSRTFRQNLEKGNFAAIEDEWLATSAENPADLDYFVAAARGLVGSGEDERARFLLQLLDEQLREQGLWPARLELLRRAGGLLLDAEALHPAILETLDELHGRSPSFAGLVEAVGLHRATHDLPKAWEKVDRLAELIPFDVGAVVFMKGKGAGRVVEANLELGSFKVDFDRFPGLTVGFRAAPKVLERLEPGHILRRRTEEPEALRTLAQEDPPELLRIVLESYREPRTAAEIRESLKDIVDEARWPAWWAAARRHPQVVIRGSGRQSYAWAASSEDAAAAAERAFAAAGPRQKLELLRREGQRGGELRDRMAAELTRLAARAAADDPGLAFEIWFALERSGAAPGDAAFAPDALLARPDPKPLIRGVQDRLLRERACTMLRERRSDWPGIFADLLWEEADPRVLSLLAEGLRGEDPDTFNRFLDQVMTQPGKTPAAFVWLAEQAAGEDDLRRRNPLRLLQQLLRALSDEAFAPYRSRLAPLAESGGTLPRLLGHLTEDQAAQAEEAVERAAGLELYQRQALQNTLHLRFPALRPEAELPLYALPESIAARQAELKQLMEVEIPANRKAIEEARALGDLRENFEYKAARQRHEYLNARAAALHRDLGRARPIDLAEVDASEVRIGTRVELAADSAAPRVLALLGPWESRPEEDVLSFESELGQGLLGKKPGESVTLEGRVYRVAKIEPYRPR